MNKTEECKHIMMAHKYDERKGCGKGVQKCTRCGLTMEQILKQAKQQALEGFKLGVSEWMNYGKKLQYWQYFEELISKDFKKRLPEKNGYCESCKQIGATCIICTKID